MIAITTSPSPSTSAASDGLSIVSWSRAAETMRNRTAQNPHGATPEYTHHASAELALEAAMQRSRLRGDVAVVPHAFLYLRAEQCWQSQPRSQQRSWPLS